jgi:hypothetical protein
VLAVARDALAAIAVAVIMTSTLKRRILPMALNSRAASTACGSLQTAREFRSPGGLLSGVMQSCSVRFAELHLFERSPKVES